MLTASAKVPVRLVSRLRGARLIVLTYHRVVASRDTMRPGEPTAVEFDTQVRILSRLFRLFTLEAALARLQDATLPTGAAVITFDDGYADNEALALPILVRHGAVATFFVASGFLDGGVMWNDRIIEAVRTTSLDSVAFDGFGIARMPLTNVSDRLNLARRLIATLKPLPLDEREAAVKGVCGELGVTRQASLMMHSTQLRTLSENGMEVGGHTVMHPILAKVTDDRARHEIEQGKRDLEQILQKPVTTFAYPNGRPGEDFKARHVEMVKEAGFAGAVSTRWDTVHDGACRWTLPRVSVWGGSGVKLVGQLLRTMAS